MTAEPAAEAPWRGDEPLTGGLTVQVNGVCVDEGPMDGVPGGPAGSLRWLARHLADHGRGYTPDSWCSPARYWR